MPFGGATAQTFLHHSKGPTLITFGGHEIGYAQDRIYIDERPSWEDLRNDIFGGMPGIPSDVQYLGSIGIVQANINRFKEAEMLYLASIDPTLEQITEGAPPTGAIQLPAMGTFMRQGDNTTSTMKPLVLSSAYHTLTFALAFLRTGRRFNTGTREQIVSLAFEVHVNDPCDMELYAITGAANPCS